MTRTDIPEVLDRLDTVISEVVGPGAADVDRDGAFPRAAIDALAAAGVLGLTVPLAYGGPGAGLQVATEVVRRLSSHCGSTAMIVAMHYTAVAVLAHVEHDESLKAVAAGEHLTTLAFSETGSRSHFWTPVSTAALESDDRVRLDARKSWVTSAHEADSYVWSSQPASEPGPMTLWYVPATTAGLRVDGAFDGLGLRGNDSCPVTADGVVIPAAARLGGDGLGLDLALSVVLPWFLTLNAAASVGLMEAVTASTAQHLTGTQLTHLNQSLAQQLPGRTRLAQARIESDRNRALLREAVAAVEAGREDAPLLVLEAKASADAGSASVTDLAMVACGGAAFRRESTVERRFRDSRAARVMAPTTDVGGERDAVSALRDGVVDAACVLDANLLLFAQEGTVASGSLRVLGHTPSFDHCVMTAGPGVDAAALSRLTEAFLAMSYADPQVRPLLDLEGLGAWLPGRTEGFGPLQRAVDEAGFYDEQGRVRARDYRP